MDNLLLTEITLQDYSVYRGKNTFDFTCSPDKPIIVIGGENGAGKTTLFESIMLCLYGMSMMGKQCTRATYKKFLSSKIHRYLKSSTSADHASITVQFKFFHKGKETEYKIERSWRKTDGEIEEYLSITKRNENRKKFTSIETIEKSNFQSFIEDLIPKRIIKLFFFDGEKIVNIAKSGTENIAIKESFKSLLGIDIIEQLNADLQVNLMRNLTKGTKHLQQEFDQFKADKDESVQTTIKLQERFAQKQTSMDSLNRDIEKLEMQISKIGGKFVSNRDELKTKLSEKEIIRESIRQKIHNLCDDVLPFALIPNEMKILVEQLKMDESIQQEHSSHKLLELKLNKIKNRAYTRKLWQDAGIDPKSASNMIKTLNEILKDELRYSDNSQKPIFGFSTKQMMRIMDIAKKSNTVTSLTLNKYTEKIIKIDKEIERFQTTIDSSPADDEIGPLVSKLGNIRSEQGMLQSEIDHIEEQITTNKALRQHLDSKLRDIVSKIYKTEKTKNGVKLTQNVQKVLEEFIKKITTKKIQLLEQYLLEGLQTLMHKNDFMSTKIDSQTFEIQLFRKNGESFPRNLLSEGEKQMLATAVLWALAKTSGRPLPFMIDTPLARLDSNHRNNLVEKFFPIVSHQILIFSTDEEIKNQYYEKLKPYMTRSYIIQYSEDEGSTKGHEGYFWDKKGEKIVKV